MPARHHGATAPGAQSLGDALRRLRGPRSLNNVATLSREASFASRIRPVGAATISQVEQGLTIPSLETLHSLAILYRVPAQGLLNLLFETQVPPPSTVPATDGERFQAFETARAARRVGEALSIVAASEPLASTETERVAWRLARAWVSCKLGMRDEAVMTAMECLDSPHLRPGQHVNVRCLLADFLTSGGQLTAAADVMRVALAALPTDSRPAQRLMVIERRARLLTLLPVAGMAPEPHGLEEALDLIAEGQRLAPADDAVTQLRLAIRRANAHDALGQVGRATREFRVAAQDAARGEHAYLEMAASINLGSVARRVGHIDEAVRYLRRAENLALEHRVTDAFDVYFELFLALERELRREGYYLRRCRRFRPLVDGWSPNVAAFDRLTTQVS